MSDIFLTVLNMSLTASYVIVFVILFRLLLKKAPKFLSYLLWSVVGFRLTFPFSFESILSLIPRNSETAIIPHDIIYQPEPQINSGVKAVDSFVNQALPKATVEASANPLQIYVEIGAYIWAIVLLAMLIYSLVSVMLLKKKLKEAHYLEKNIFEADKIKTPFLLGIVRPYIYLPMGLSDEERSYIVLHEQTHIRRKDHVIKILAFIILSIHWFNPLVWLSFMLMSTDMELSCDERVLKEMNEDIKKSYAYSLLSLAAGRHILNGNPLAFGEGNVRGRIRNVLNYRKSSFWVIDISLTAVILIGIALAANPKKTKSDELNDDYTINSFDFDNEEYVTDYNRVRIALLSDMMAYKEANEFETNALKIIAYIDSTLRTGLTASIVDNLDNNHTNKYRIELAKDNNGTDCLLYYDTLYNKAYIEKEGGLYSVSTDFARYIDSLLENTSITIIISRKDAEDLFKKYGWTLDYQINAMNYKLNNINSLSGFNPNAFYFAYNNELSKDIGLDMSSYSNAEIDVEIYRIHESMPQEFYPIQNCRGIVVRKNDTIIGAFISAGRHSSFNACSLKGNSFKKVTGMTADEWLARNVTADDIDAGLSKLEAEEVISEYFAAVNNKDAQMAKYCISKKTMLGSLTVNMPDSEVFNEGIALPLTGTDMGSPSAFDNLKEAKLINIQLLEESDENRKIFRVTAELQYNKEIVISNGQQYWDCYMIYESKQTGWKIEGFGR